MEMSETKLLKKDPVVIGALGGSGTRLIAQTLMELGYYLGDEIDEQNDSLLFTRIFQRPDWIRTTGRENFDRYLSMFTRRMTGEGWSLTDIIRYITALYRKSTIKSGRRKELIHAFTQNWCSGKHQLTRWGWKEPISHLFLQELVDYFPNMKYIHVIRHGLDMAFSTNTQQLRYWGYRYDLSVNLEKDNIPYMQLEYWIRSNKQAIETARNSLGSNFYLLNYDEYCQNPEPELERLLEFLDIKTTDEECRRLVNLSKPTSTGRYKNRNIRLFNDRQISEVTQLGFEV